MGFTNPSQSSNTQKTRESGYSHQRRQGGRATTYRGAKSADTRSGMGAYQHSVRTGGASRGSRNRRDMPVRGQGGVRRPGPSETQLRDLNNEAFFSDVTQQRFGGDGSVPNRLLGMYGDFGGKANPTGSVDWYNKWSKFKDPNQFTYNQGEYEWAKGQGEDYRAGQQAADLEGQQMTVNQGFI